MVYASLADVASLWKLALVVVVLIFIVLYRKPLTTLLERGTLHFKRGGTEVAVSGPSTPTRYPGGVSQGESDLLPPEADDATEVVAVSDGDEPAVVTEERDSAPTLGKVFVAVRAGDADMAAVTFSELQEQAADDEERLRNQVAFATFRAMFGDDAAVAELKTLASDPTVGVQAQGALARVYLQAGLPDRALAIFNDMLYGASCDTQVVSAAAGVATCLRDLGRGDEAFPVLYGALARVDGDDAKRDLHIELADHYEVQGDWFHRAVALDKAAEFSPGDAGLRFRVAYAFAQADFDELALMHYKATLALSPDDAAARNNLGVAYEGLEMPIHAVAAYREAVTHGNTLGSANLANSLTKAGFADEAKDILSRAASAADVHPNVAANQARLQAASAAEVEAERQADHRAQAMDLFFRDYGSALTSPDGLAQLGGEWLLDDAISAQIEQHGSNIQIDWSDGTTPKRLAGSILGRGLKLTRFAREYSLGKRDHEFVPKDSAYGYFVTADEFRVSLCASPDSRIVRTFRRQS